MSRSKLHGILLAGASLGALLSAPQAFAQATSEPAATGLEEVVVTATRQTDTVNRVPLSIAAVTQQTLDEQGIKQAGDIARLVPGLVLAPGAITPGVGSFAIRGIVGGNGAATTGVYLDDSAVTKRQNNGVRQNNGAPLPILYDLERVEVLKGPQGTLYGGSSQGGTIRFITPTPSLTTFSGSARLEGSKVQSGYGGFEVAAALGGPIIQDKLAFRISALDHKIGGYLNAVSPYTGQTVGKNVNAVYDRMVRGSLLWQVNDRGSVLLSGYHSVDRVKSGITAPTTVYSKTANAVKASSSETFTTPQVCLNTQTRATAGPGGTNVPVLVYDPTLPVGGDTRGPTAIVPAQVNCNTAGAPGVFVRPSLTYGPFNLGKNDNLLTTQQDLTGSRTLFNDYAITLQYDFEHMTVKSITSYVQDHSYSEGAGGEDQTQQQRIVGGPVNPTAVVSPIAGANGIVGFPLWSVFPDYPGHFKADSVRNGIEQELRFSSPGNQKPFNWVAGVFYSNQRIRNHYFYPDSKLDASLLGFEGVSLAQRYGINATINNAGTELNANISDNELAAFAEVNYWLTDKLKITAGERLSRIAFSYRQTDTGAFSSRFPNTFSGLSTGKSQDTPSTPKIGATYEFTPSDLVYVSAAKGFRAGGANAPVAQAVCGPGLALYGITSTDIPPAFGPDTVWSYEAGGKFRLLDNKLQVNGAVYRIDWSGIQSSITLTCGQGFVINGGKARSEGVDFQGQYRPIQPLTLSLNVGYDNARYIDPVAGPRGLVPGVAPSINAGDHFAIPKWQVSASVDYDVKIGDIDGYARVDYQWQDGYTQPGTFGVAAYNPFTLRVGSRDYWNARVGARFAAWDLNVFVNNVLNGRDKIGNAGNGKTQCVATSRDCSIYNNFNPFVNQVVQRPREFGVQANYRF
jgi:outer membrane receptor protein involved in Fe transport